MQYLEDASELHAVVPRHENCANDGHCQRVADANHPVDEAMVIHLDRITEETDGRQPGHVERHTDRQNGHATSGHQVVVDAGVLTPCEAVVEPYRRRTSHCQRKYDVVGPVEAHRRLRYRHHVVSGRCVLWPTGAVTHRDVMF